MGRCEFRKLRGSFHTMRNKEKTKKIKTLNTRHSIASRSITFFDGRFAILSTDQAFFFYILNPLPVWVSGFFDRAGRHCFQLL